MGTDFDSFVRSSLGMFVASQLDARAGGPTGGDIFALGGQSTQDKSLTDPPQTFQYSDVTWWDEDAEEWTGFLRTPPSQYVAVYKGEIYSSTSRGVQKWTGQWEWSLYVDDPNLANYFLVVHDGMLWFGFGHFSSDGGLYRFDGTTWLLHTTFVGMTFMRDMISAHDKLFVSGQDLGVARFNEIDVDLDGCGYFDGEQWIKAHDLAFFLPVEFFVLPDGKLWAASEGGACVEEDGETCPERISFFNVDVDLFRGWGLNDSPTSPITSSGQIGDVSYCAGFSLWRLNSSWANIASNVFQGGRAQAAISISEDGASVIWFGGGFTSVDFNPVERVASYNGTSFSQVGEGFSSGTVRKLTRLPIFNNPAPIFRAIGEYALTTQCQDVTVCGGDTLCDVFGLDIGTTVWRLDLNGPSEPSRTDPEQCDSVTWVRRLTNTEAVITKAVGLKTGLTFLFDNWNCACLDGVEGPCGPTSQGNYFRTQVITPGTRQRWSIYFSPDSEPTAKIDECFNITLGV